MGLSVEVEREAASVRRACRETLDGGYANHAPGSRTPAANSVSALRLRPKHSAPMPPTASETPSNACFETDPHAAHSLPERRRVAIKTRVVGAARGERAEQHERGSHPNGQPGARWRRFQHFEQFLPEES